MFGLDDAPHPAGTRPCGATTPTTTRVASQPRVVATAPNMVWVWDISRLPGPTRGTWLYLYAVWDLWSRKTIGWCVDTTETAGIAETLMTVTCAREHVVRHQLTIHSDRGAQMTAGTITELYDQLGIRRSLSRPRVSNDCDDGGAAVVPLEDSLSPVCDLVV